jgi:Na+/phosphate symporter
MTLYEKIKTIYPELTNEDFHPIRGTIKLQNDLEHIGDYIKSWNHPTLTRPTEAQLEAAE